jgi:hypothetical protein
MWHPIRTAPFRRDIQIANMRPDHSQILPFACQRVSGGWLKAGTQQQIEMRPTHWRVWPGKRVPAFYLAEAAN